MKKAVTILFLCIAVISFAQTSKKHGCGTMEYHDYLIKNRPGYAESFTKYNQMIDEYIKNSNNNTSSTQRLNSIVTIPVVFHVVYNTPDQNISDTQVLSQLQVLNLDFAKQNTDIVNVTQSFSTSAGASNIRFCIAQRDPLGYPTNGITRTQTSVSSFTNSGPTANYVKFTNHGGYTAWDVSKYLNVWICNIDGNVIGYGEFPTTNLSNTWGLVLDYAYTGTGGITQPPYHLGRTGTHEVGHCFNLRHIWGDDGGACTGSDQCADTPNQADLHFGSFPPGSIQTDACSTTAPGVMWMNYMDYSNDDSKYMFTNNQCARINAIINNPPYNILQISDGCMPPPLDASITSILNSFNGFSRIYCNSVVPKVVLQNLSTIPLTSAKILSKFDATPTRTLTWAGNLPIGASATVTLSAYNSASSGFTYGAHTFSVWVSNPNGSIGSDNYPPNDSKNSRFFLGDCTTTLTVKSTGLQRLGNLPNVTDESKSLEITSVYPNPANDILTINLSYLPANTVIELYDMFGKLVIIEKAHDTLITLSVSNLAEGVYSIRVVSDDNIKLTKRIIVK